MGAEQKRSRVTIDGLTTEETSDALQLLAEYFPHATIVPETMENERTISVVTIQEHVSEVLSGMGSSHSDKVNKNKALRLLEAIYRSFVKTGEVPVRVLQEISSAKNLGDLNRVVSELKKEYPTLYVFTYAMGSGTLARFKILVKDLLL